MGQEENKQPKTQKLDGVCNGVHLFELHGWTYEMVQNQFKAGPSEETILKSMGWELGDETSLHYSINDVPSGFGTPQTKGILIVQTKNEAPQGKVIDLLAELSKREKGPGLAARKLDRWSNDSELWMVRVLHNQHCTWENQG